ncbi:MAG: amidohydrolase family protein [Spirochaetales bacterium]|nr:amidohydrolase family protein [Spirochaetales bacterium]
MVKNEILLKNMIIVDGTGGQPYLGSILICGEKITKIERENNDANKFTQMHLNTKIIDGKGKLIVSPGFIDMHSHSDLAPFARIDSVLFKSAYAGKINQGVCTEICGQDGYSAVPVTEAMKIDFFQNWKGLTGEANWQDYDATDFQDFFKKAQKSPYPIRIKSLTGHNNLRIAVNGYEKNALSAKQISQMRSLLTKSFEQGSYGLSLGLIYSPGMFGNKEELLELAKESANYNKIIMAHMRNESDSVLEALDEYGSICKSAKAKMHISHLKVCGENNFNKGPKIIERIRQLNKDGVDISYDMYPYTAGSTVLHAIFPPEAHQGGPKQLLQRLSDKKEQERIFKRIFEEESKDWDNFIGFSKGKMEGIVIASAPNSHSFLSGKSLAEIGRMAGYDVNSDSGLRKTFELICQYEIETNLDLAMISYNQDQTNMKNFLMQQDLMTIGTDGVTGVHPHPRLFGAFPRYIRLLLDEGVEIEKIIHSITGRPRARLNLESGLLKEELPADLVIFDPTQIKDTATWEEPKQRPTGIEHVIIGGKLLV